MEVEEAWQVAEVGKGDTHEAGLKEVQEYCRGGAGDGWWVQAGCLGVVGAALLLTLDVGDAAEQPTATSSSGQGWEYGLLPI